MSQQYPTNAEKWECKEQNLQDTIYFHHSAQKIRASTELFPSLDTELQGIEKTEKIHRRVRNVERGLTNILVEKDLNKCGCFAYGM